MYSMASLRFAAFVFLARVFDGCASEAGSGKITEDRKHNLIQEALHHDQMSQYGEMHDWWCDTDEKDTEPLCEVWDAYHGDTSQYHKIPKDRIPTQESVQLMHSEYCAAHPDKELCVQWLREKSAREGKVDPDSQAVFGWWCAEADTKVERRNLCDFWQSYVDDPLAPPKEGLTPPSKKDIDAVNSAYCMDPTHHHTKLCKNSPWAMGKTPGKDADVLSPDQRPATPEAKLVKKGKKKKGGKGAKKTKAPASPGSSEL